MRLNRPAMAVFVLLMMSAKLSATDTEAPTYAERLGWPAGTKAVIFHVDDAGMSHNSNMGAIRAIEDGVATSVSVMMPCSWVPEFADYVKAHPEVDAGIHLTLTSEWNKYRWGPVAGKPAVPGLTDSDGYLWRSVSDVAARFTTLSTFIPGRASRVRTRWPVWSKSL